MFRRPDRPPPGFRWLSLILLLPCAGPIQAQDQPPEAPQEADQPDTDAASGHESQRAPFDLLTTKTLTGDWGGVRSKLEDEGIRFKIDLMNQLMVNMHGGKETKNGHDTAGSYEFNIYLDFEKMELIQGAEFWIRAKGTWGGDDSDFDKEKVGGLFKTNQDASSEEPIFVDKWHWKQRFFDDRLEFRIGRMEPVKDLFDTSEIMGHEDKYFMNQALVRNATIPPRKGLGVFVNWNISDAVYVRAAAIDAHARDRQTNFNTAFHDEDEFRCYGEIGWRPKFTSAKGKLPGHYLVGTWYDPTTKKKFFDTLNGLRADRYDSEDWGFYLGFDQMVWKENDQPEDQQGIAVAGRYGYAHGEVNMIEHFWAAAIQYKGVMPRRDKDVLAFGAGQGILSGEYRQLHPGADRETVYELYYSAHVLPWLTVSPHLQFITNTGGYKGDPDTTVAGLRFRMTL
ncbi:MAG: carbohydrate porin [Phycisphaerales bacterium]|nr:MAG: carbohydrate porin [Phycisphaerales bacterium]